MKSSYERWVATALSFGSAGVASLEAPPFTIPLLVVAGVFSVLLHLAPERLFKLLNRLVIGVFVVLLLVLISVVGIGYWLLHLVGAA